MIRYVLIITGIAAGITFCSNAQASATSLATTSCKNYDFVFARGSGDTGKLDLDPPSQAFKSTVEKILEGKASFNLYLLGTEEYDGFQYPHIEISGGLRGYNSGAGAELTNGEGYSYGKSVDQGVGELTAYLTKRMANCPDSKYIIGGYSQGAQVVGDALFRLTTEQQDKITYVALFGDPKLYLPEAAKFTVFDQITDDIQQSNPYYKPGSPLPDSCYGYNLSPWRHTIDDCMTQKGTLFTPRNPFMPKNMDGKVHEWCFNHDGICDGSEVPWGPGHTEYNTSRGVESAVNEALDRSGFSTQVVDETLETAIAGKVDVMVFMNYYCTMPLAPGIEFNDPTYSIRHAQDPTNPQVKFIGQAMYDGPAYDESTLANQLPKVTPQYTFPQRDDASLIYLVLTRKLCVNWWNAGAKWINDNWHFNMPIITANLKASNTGKQPVIRVLTVPDDQDTLSTNPEQTTTFTASASSPITTLSALLSKPTFSIALSNHDYLANKGDALRFTVGQHPENIIRYEWDFDGDGVYETSSVNPSILHSYSETFAGTVRVRAVNSENQVGKDSATVTIAEKYIAPAKPDAVKWVAITKNSSSSVEVSWKPKSANPAHWIVRSNGYPLGYLDGSQHSVIINDVVFDEPYTVSIAAISNEDIEGPETSATISPNETKNNPSLNRTGDDVARLVTSYDIGTPTPPATAPVDTPPSDPSTDVLGTQDSQPATDTETQNNSDDSQLNSTVWIIAGILFASIITSGIIALSNYYKKAQK